MAIVVFNGKSYECARAVKGVDYVKLYDENNAVIIAFSGISDFSAFTLTEGEWETGVSTQTVAAYAELVNGVIQLTLLKSVSVETGLTVTFQSPCDCTEASGLSISGVNYTLVDAAGVALEAEFKAFAQNAMVRVILHTDENKAYIQNGAATTIEAGGTGANNAPAALLNLGAAAIDLSNVPIDLIKNINKHYWKRQEVEASVEPMWSEPKAVQRVLGSSGSAENTFKIYTSTKVVCTFNTETLKCELTLDSPKTYSSTYGNAGNTASYFRGKYWSFALDGSAPIYYSEPDIDVSGGWLGGTGYHITVPATLVRGVVRTTGEIENLHSESADAYPVGIQDGYLYTYIGIPGENLLNSKAVYGSYVGTGTYGSDSENELFFDTIPDVIIFTGQGYILPKLGTGIWFGGHLSNYSLISRTEGNTVYWYGTEDALRQLNQLNSVYKYVAI